MNQVKRKKEKGKKASQLRARAAIGSGAHRGFGLNFFLFPFHFFLRRTWWWLRQFSGDAAYENYLASLARRGESACCDPERAVSREEFYVESLRRRYSGVSRCC